MFVYKYLLNATGQLSTDTTYKVSALLFVLLISHIIVPWMAINKLYIKG